MEAEMRSLRPLLGKRIKSETQEKFKLNNIVEESLHIERHMESTCKQNK
jgi:hypothetical protein